jgi:hypothetical protein
MNREEQVIERIKTSVAEDGYTRKDIRYASKNGIGDAKSYFDALVDIKLEGKAYPPRSQEVWEEMKAQINYLTGCLVKASEDYAKLQNKVRHLEADKIELMRLK